MATEKEFSAEQFTEKFDIITERFLGIETLIKEYISCVEKSHDRSNSLSIKIDNLDDFVKTTKDQLDTLQTNIQKFAEFHTLNCNYIQAKDAIFGERKEIVKSFLEERDRIDKDIKINTESLGSILEKLEDLEQDQIKSRQSDVDIEDKIKNLEDQIQSLREHLDNGWSKKIINDILEQNKNLFEKLLDSKTQNDNNNFALQKAKLSSKKAITLEKIKLIALLAGSGSVIWLIIDKLLN